MLMAPPSPAPWVSSENLRAMMMNYSRVSSSGGIHQRPGITLVDSGVSFSAFNAALLAETPVDKPRDLRARLQQAQRYFSGARKPWSFWMPDEIVSPPVREAAEISARAAGLRWIAQHEGMIAEDLNAPLHELPTLEYRRVFDRVTRAHFAKLSCSVFELPPPVSAIVYGQSGFWSGTLSAWVGYLEGKPVCCAATEAAAGVIGLYSVATLEKFRRRGFAEAITRHALDDARRSTGIRHHILHATRSGQPLYRQMGFRYATRLDVYVST
ncbi:MAG: GNAT family N-acetyltransferase [Acidobacteriota bacterium]